MTAEARGLECLAGGTVLLIPEENVEQVIELDASPLPLSEGWIRGAALHQGRLVVVVGLGGARTDEVRRTIKGVLLSLPGAPIAVAVEVESIAKIQTAPRAAGAATDGWLRTTRSADGAEVRWLDVDRLRARVAGTPWNGGPS